MHGPLEEVPPNDTFTGNQQTFGARGKFYGLLKQG